MASKYLQLSIKEAVESIKEKKYLMPALQREFIWGPNQICDLFDSVFRGYPMGALLFWEVKPPNVEDYAYFDFLTEFHELIRQYADPAQPNSGQAVTAILDGQQRLTALNIGLCGSHTSRRKHGRRNNIEHYEKKRLYIKMEQETGADASFVFLTDEEAKTKAGEPNFSFRVSKILPWERFNSRLWQELKDLHHLSENDAHKFQNLIFDLWQEVCNDNTLLANTITFDDPNKVLEAFVRLNQKGTTLSNADFLLSMATNQWEHEDARQVVRNLVETLNRIGNGFQFEKAMILKAGLAIIGAPIGFNLSNFKMENSRKIEELWSPIASSLEIAALLLQAFGFDETNLPVKDAVMIPLAMFIFHRQKPQEIVTHGAFREEREEMKKYVYKAALVQDYWGRGLDTKLSIIRDVIETTECVEFPNKAVELALREAGLELEFEDQDLDEIVDLQYGKKYTFPALSLLFDHIDFSKEVFHQDHIFPKKLTTKSALESQGLDARTVDTIQELRDGLPNLQLLSGQANYEKQSQMPLKWLNVHFSNTAKRNHFCSSNELGNIPENIEEFPAWYEVRRQRLVDMLRTRLSI
jgi:hypothetical protein